MGPRLRQPHACPHAVAPGLVAAAGNDAGADRHWPTPQLHIVPLFDRGEKGINIQVISTSEIKISVLIDASYTELAVRALHTAYGLDAD